MSAGTDSSRVVRCRLVVEQLVRPALQHTAVGPLQLSRDALGDVVVGPGPVVEALGAVGQVAAPSLVEPDLGAADGGTEGLDRSAGEARGNSAMTSGQFVGQGYLRVAAVGGCPRGYSCTGDGAGGGSPEPWTRAQPASELSDALSVRGDRN